MKIKGHPIHIMLIHFPAALFPLDFLGSLGAKYLHLEGLEFFSFYGLIAGVFFGWVAALFGVLDILGFQKKPNSEAALVQGFIHGSIQTVVLIGYTFIAAKALQSYPILRVPDLWLIASKGALVLLLIVGNFVGGELMLKTLSKVEE